MEKKNLFIIFILVVIIGVGYNLYRARKSPAEGFQMGSMPIPESPFRNYYVFRFDTKRGFDNQIIKEPMYAIFWKSKPAVSKQKSSWHLVQMINEDKLSIPTDQKAMYALHPDFTLSILPLNENEMNTLFELFLSREKKHEFYKNTIYKTQIAPNIMIVEIPEK